MNFAYANENPNVLPATHVLFYTSQTHVTIQTEVDVNLGPQEVYVELRTPRRSPYGIVTSYDNGCLVVHVTRYDHIANRQLEEMHGVMGEVYSVVTPHNAHFAPVRAPGALRYGGDSEFIIVLHVGRESEVQYALSA